MNTVSRLNDVLAYIEEHLDEQIENDLIYKMAGMSKVGFQRFFLLVADMPLGEYIRNLRLSQAAAELLHSDTKIIDISLKYGYESAAAFSRAFKNLFGSTPSDVRKDNIRVSFSPLKFQIEIGEEEMKMNEKSIVRVEEHVNEKVVCFEVDCYEAETEAWGQMSKWCKQYIPDRTARRFVGLAPKGHHPGGEQHVNACEHVKHPYIAMMLLVGDEGKNETFHGLTVQDAPQGLFLVNDVALNQYDSDGNLDMALSMIKASDAFVEFVQNTKSYEFNMAKGVFYEEHIFSEQWFQNGGVPTAFKMWVPILMAK